VLLLGVGLTLTVGGSAASVAGLIPGGVQLFLLMVGAVMSAVATHRLRAET
jgi:hypothetical protein